MFSYQNGILFGLLSGSIASLLIVRLLSTLPSPANRVRIVLCFNAIQLVAITVINVWISSSIPETSTQLLVENPSYQLSGTTLASIALVASTLCGSAVLNEDSPGTLGLRIVTLIATELLLGMLSYTSQLLGSNSGTVCILGIAGLLSAFGILSVMRHRSVGEPAVSRTVVGAGFAVTSLVLALGCWLVAVEFYLSDASKMLRIFGFNEHTLLNSSVSSRIDLADQFWTHWSYSPVVGEFFVDRLTTGPGTYIHSLVSTLPHLGLMGTALLLIYLLTVAAEIASRIRHERRRACATTAVFSAALLALILLTALASAFLTWTPLWFALGLLASPIALKPFGKGVIAAGVAQSDHAPNINKRPAKPRTPLHTGSLSAHRAHSQGSG